MGGLVVAALLLGIITGNDLVTGLSLVLLGLLCTPAAVILLTELAYGIPVPTLRERGEVLELSTPFGSRRVVALEIRDVRHGVMDLTPIRHYGVCKAFLEGLLVEPDASYTLIYEKLKTGFRTILLIVPKRDVSERKLISMALNIIKQLRPLGIEARVMTTPPTIPFHAGASGYRLILLPILLLMGILAVGRGAYSIGFLAVLYSSASLTASCIIRGYARRVDGEMYVLKGNESMYTEPSYEELYSRARWLFELVNGLSSFTMIMRFEKAPAYVGVALERRAFSLYERATAFDKLSLMVRADRILKAVERHFHRRETLLLFSMLLIAPRREALALRSALDVAGLRMGRCLLRAPAVWSVLGLP